MNEERPISADLRYTTNLIKSYINKKMSRDLDLELTGTECLTLTYIFHRDPEKVVAGELMRRFGVSKATISQTVRALKSKGYVIQSYSKRDHRVKFLALSAKGKNLKARFDAMFTEINDSLVRGFSDEEKGALRSLLKKLQDNILPPAEAEAAAL